MTISTREESAVEVLASCPLCDGQEHTRLPPPGHRIGSEVFGAPASQIGLVRCRGCGLVFTNPRPSPDRLHAYYAGDPYVCHDTAGSASAGAKASLVLKRVA